MIDASPLPTENQEQTCLFRWAKMQECDYPKLRLLYHIPNGGSRHRLEAVHLKQQGVRAGVPDICLPVACGGCHSLYIEMKRLKGGRVSPEQMGCAAVTISGGGGINVYVLKATLSGTTITFDTMNRIAIMSGAVSGALTTSGFTISAIRRLI
ncbi:MAG TPA: VRR-NUC domain-containing protein [Candidatus Limiplasma sp.]|nr:VRR-NUC domain-containing protein [Candidatus Limiplasma sp.]